MFSILPAGLRRRSAKGVPVNALVSPALGWALAVAAVAAGYLGYGWRGVALAGTVIAFWLLLQFSRSLRALRAAAGRPVGQVPNAVMLHAKLNKGMRLPEILKLTHSLGRKTADAPETFVWADEAGDSVTVELQDGRVSGWQLQRAQPSTAA